MKKFKISFPSLFIGAGVGFILGLLVLGLFVNYLIGSAISNAPTNGSLLGGAIDQVRAGMAQAAGRKNSRSVYGQVLSIGGGTLVISASQLDGSRQNMSFVYDNSTKFVYLANNAASTPTPLSTDAIAQGDGLTITTAEPIGSVENQYAVTVTRY